MNAMLSVIPDLTPSCPARARPGAMARWTMAGLIGGICLSGRADPPPSPAAPPAAEIARLLNQAFVDVASNVTPSVVVVSVAHRPHRRMTALEGHPFFDMLPDEFKERLEEPREPGEPREPRSSPPDSDRNRERRRRSEKKKEEVPPPAERKPKAPAEADPAEEGPDAREPVFDGEGSGIIVRREGYIVTNRHVIEDADRVRVRLMDGTEFDAVVRGVDAQSDLAVLKIDPAGQTLRVAKLGNSRAVQVGDFSIAIGAPLDLDYSVTFGHISAKGRSRILDDPAMDQDFLQTDANINPGNSGGPLVNIHGEVIGINTLIRGLRTGIGFAIPSNLVREVTDQLIDQGHFTRAYLGVRIHSLRDSSEYRDAVTGVKDGVVVFAIPPGSPAAKSELKPGDVILAVDGQAVASPQELRNEIRGKAIGSRVALDVHRFGRKLQVDVRPEAWPESEEQRTPAPKPALARSPAPDAAGPKTPGALGLKVDTLTREHAEHFHLERKAGVIVTEVERNSPAQRHGLRPGDIITEVNLKPVTSVKQFNEALRDSDPQKGVVLHFQTAGTSRFEILKGKR